MIRVVLLALFIITSPACDRDDPNIHLKDPIFKDLDRRAKESKSVLTEKKKKLDELRIQLKKAEPNSLEQKDFQREVAKAEREVLDREQKLKYYEIRAARRAVVAKLAAKEAKANNKPWPDPSEYSGYLLNTRLNEVDRNWSERVPKLHDRVVKPQATSQKPPETSAH